MQLLKDEPSIYTNVQTLHRQTLHKTEELYKQEDELQLWKDLEILFVSYYTESQIVFN